MSFLSRMSSPQLSPFSSPQSSPLSSPQAVRLSPQSSPSSSPQSSPPSSPQFSGILYFPTFPSTFPSQPFPQIPSLGERQQSVPTIPQPQFPSQQTPGQVQFPPQQSVPTIPQPQFPSQQTPSRAQFPQQQSVPTFPQSQFPSPQVPSRTQFPPQQSVPVIPQPQFPSPQFQDSSQFSFYPTKGYPLKVQVDNLYVKFNNSYQIYYKSFNDGKIYSMSPFHSLDERDRADLELKDTSNLYPVGSITLRTDRSDLFFFFYQNDKNTVKLLIYQHDSDGKFHNLTSLPEDIHRKYKIITYFIREFPLNDGPTMKGYNKKVYKSLKSTLKSMNNEVPFHFFKYMNDYVKDDDYWSNITFDLDE